MACERITAGITRKAHWREVPSRRYSILTIPTGSTIHVNFNTSKKDRYETDSRRCQINWVILDSDWESEFCRVAEAHPRVKAYVKNHNLGLEVPYRYGSEESKSTFPTSLCLIDDGHRSHFRMVVTICCTWWSKSKATRREDAKEKKATMETYWVPGVNHLGTHGRWDFAEFTEMYEIEADFEGTVEQKFNADD